MEERFLHVSDGKGGVKDLSVRLPNGHLDIITIQETIRNGVPIVADGELINVALEILGRYPIGIFPVVPQKAQSKFRPTLDDDPMLNDLLMEIREGPQGG